MNDHTVNDDDDDISNDAKLHEQNSGKTTDDATTTTATQNIHRTSSSSSSLGLFNFFRAPQQKIQKFVPQNGAKNIGKIAPNTIIQYSDSPWKVIPCPSQSDIYRSLLLWWRTDGDDVFVTDNHQYDGITLNEGTFFIR
jgi:hypothetical protein